MLFLAGEYDRTRKPQRNRGFGRAWKGGYPTLDPTVGVIGRVAAAGSGPGGLGRRGRRRGAPEPRSGAGSPSGGAGAAAPRAGAVFGAGAAVGGAGCPAAAGAVLAGLGRSRSRPSLYRCVVRTRSAVQRTSEPTSQPDGTGVVWARRACAAADDAVFEALAELADCEDGGTGGLGRAVALDLGRSAALQLYAHLAPRAAGEPARRIGGDEGGRRRGRRSRLVDPLRCL